MTDSRAQVSTRVALQQAQKSAEELFERRSISEIKNVEAQTRKDIENKKVQLRELVGASYHDLISSADIIVAMAQACEQVSADISHIQCVFRDLAKTMSVDRSGLDRSRNVMPERQAHLYAIGTRIKYLIDTPEAIWGLLDAGQVLAAARHLGCAQCVHASLASVDERMLLRQFPLLPAQWQAITSKQADILSRADAVVADSADATRVADALAAVCCLTECDLASLLERYLRLRRQGLERELAAHKQEPSIAKLHNGSQASSPSAAQQLILLGSKVQQALQSVGLLFMQVENGAAEELPDATGGALDNWMAQQDPLICRIVWDQAEAGANLVFEPLSSTAASDTEASAWTARVRGLHGRLRALSVSDTAAVCMEWLQGFSKLAARALESLHTCAELDAVAQAVQGALRSWSSTASAGADGLAIPWPMLARSILGSGTLDVWTVLFESSLVSAAEHVVRSHHDRSFRALEAHLDEWVGKVGGSEGTGGGEGSAAWGGGMNVRHSVRAGMATLDASLRDGLVDLLALLQPRRAAGGTGRLASGWTKVQTSRQAVLPAALQDSCETAALRTAKRIQELLDEQLEAADAGRRTEKLVLLGRASHSLMVDSRALPLLLGPVEEWSVSAITQPLGPAVPPAPVMLRAQQASATRMRPLVEALDSASCTAFAAWAKSSANRLANSYAQHLATEAVLQATVVPSNWHKVTVSTREPVDSGDDSEFSFRLPTEPLTATITLLMAVLRELQVAGGPAAPPAARTCLTAELLASTSTNLRLALHDAGTLAKLSDQGTLQLLFDVSCLCELWEPQDGDSAGAAVLAAGTTPTTAQLHAHSRELQRAIISRLDPIDWATFEVHLRKNVRDCLLRKAVLLGLFVPPSLLATAEQGKREEPQDVPFLDMAPVCPRLQLLPIALPSVEPSALPMHPMLQREHSTQPLQDTQTPAHSAAAMQAHLAAQITGVPVLLDKSGKNMADLASAYSFGNLQLRKSVLGVDASHSQEGTGGMANVAMDTWESMGARIAGSATSAFAGKLGFGSVQEHIGSFSSALNTGGVFSSSIFGSAFGKQQQSQ